MKTRYFLLLIFTVFLSTSLLAQESGEGSGEAILSLEESSFDFGDIRQGEKVVHSFEFTNTGNQPLLLSNVLVQCGCTATEWPKEAIEPGETATVSIEFDSSDKLGIQKKVVTLVSNAVNHKERIHLHLNVLPNKNFKESEK